MKWWDFVKFWVSFATLAIGAYVLVLAVGPFWFFALLGAWIGACVVFFVGWWLGRQFGLDEGYEAGRLAGRALEAVE